MNDETRHLIIDRATRCVPLWEIARDLGITLTEATAVLTAYNDALRAAKATDVELERMMMRERLSAYQRALRPAVDEQCSKAVAASIRADERIAKLLGLDRPTVEEKTTTDIHVILHPPKPRGADGAA